MLAFDSHLDLAWNAIDWNRNLLDPVAKIRESEKGMDAKGRACNTVAFPDLRRGKVTTFIATILARLMRTGAMPAIQSYTSPQASYAAGYGQIAYYRALEEQGVLRWIKDARSLQEHIRQWESNEDGDWPLGFILSMEGSDPILSPEQVGEWYQAGLRIIGPSHYGISPYTHGTGTEGGLLPRGKPLLKEMERVGMILDVTHLSDQCFDEALDVYGGPVLASHHNCRALVPNQRQLTDAQIKTLLARKAVIGAAFDNWMIIPDWVRGKSDPKTVKIEDVLKHIDHICQLAGNAQQAALGTDLDGGFGTEQSPSDLDTIADVQKIPDMLRKRGYSDDAVKDIMYRNWVRFFVDAWK